jgi:formylglycine-generating enzyme required for sulfatase activity
MRWKEYVPVGLEPVDSHPAGISPEGIYNLIGNAAEWTSSLSLAGVTSYEEMKFWDGNPETFNGNSTYIEKGGGWNIYVDEVGTFDPQRGTSALNDLGFRCAADVK